MASAHLMRPAARVLLTVAMEPMHALEPKTSPLEALSTVQMQEQQLTTPQVHVNQEVQMFGTSSNLHLLEQCKLTLADLPPILFWESSKDAVVPWTFAMMTLAAFNLQSLSPTKLALITESKSLDSMEELDGSISTLESQLLSALLMQTELLAMMVTFAPPTMLAILVSALAP